VEGTRQIIDAAVKLNIKKLVYTSSAGVVFVGEDLENATEDLPYPTVPMDPYNETKALAEQMVIAANGQNGLMTVALRPASIYGCAIFNPHVHHDTHGSLDPTIDRL
jgi:sterol-4alpha-carboxylate 3-dehydrogenase (decarboxylating)